MKLLLDCVCPLQKVLVLFKAIVMSAKGSLHYSLNAMVIIIDHHSITLLQFSMIEEGLDCDPV